ncbi:MAG: flagellar basal body-associated FliL family protein [Desulfovibrio sp.]
MLQARVQLVMPGAGASGGASGHGGAGASGGAGEGRIERQGDLPRSSGQVLPLPPITVNISDPSGRRYLKLGMEVEVNADVAAALQANNPRIRDAIIMLLAGKTFNDISTPDGKVLLKAEVAARLNQILGAQRVIRVYFTDFVVE